MKNRIEIWAKCFLADKYCYRHSVLVGTYQEQDQDAAIAKAKSLTSFADIYPAFMLETIKPDDYTILTVDLLETDEFGCTDFVDCLYKCKITQDGKVTEILPVRPTYIPIPEDPVAYPEEEPTEDTSEA